MAHHITIAFLTVKLNLPEGKALLSPLLDIPTIFVDRKLSHLAEKYANLFQQQVLNRGEFHRLLEIVSLWDFYKAEVRVPFKASRKGDYPDFELIFDYFFQETANGLWAVVPILGVECFVPPLANIEEQLTGVIRMDFTQKRRLDAVQHIVATMWYEATELVQQQVELKFGAPAELEELAEGTQEKWLPRVARKLQIERREVYGRAKQLDQLARALKGRFNKSVLLVGPSGVGKTALIHELVRLKNKHRIRADFWETTASDLIKELTNPSGWQDNLAFLCKELAEQSDYLVVRNFNELFEVGQYEGNSLNMAEFLRPYLSRGEINLISECTEEELARIDLKSPNLTSYFSLQKIDEPKADLEEIIIQKVRDIAQVRKKNLELEAIKETIRLTKRFSPYAGMPGKPIRFLESILIHQPPDDDRVISKQKVIQHFCEESGMPGFLVDPKIPMDLAKIEADFKRQLFGQDVAVEKIVELLGAVKTAMTRTGKPIASFLFVGPTGVGKTEMAKILAQFTFGDRKNMIRFDMSEFADAYSVLRLSGTSYQAEGLLTSAVRRSPFSVLLFDEIEKAHTSFFDLLLQMLGEGRLTDSKGQLVNFCSTIIIMTSNIGATALMNKPIGWTSDPSRTEGANPFLTAVQAHFRPELYNRIDQVIPFQTLDKGSTRKVIEREISLLKKREGIRFRNMELQLTDEVLDHLARLEADAKYGAREVQRLIRKKIIIPLSKALNEEDYDDQLVVKFSLVKGRIDLKVASDPLGLELLLEELEKINLADQASDLRRHMAAIFDANSYLNMVSDFDMLDREQKRKENKFYSQAIKVEQYNTTLALKSSFEQLQREIQDYERELALQCMELVAYQPSYAGRLKGWQEDLYVAKKQLVSYLNEGANQCYLYLYGRKLEAILKFYHTLIHEKGFELKLKAIWYRKPRPEEETKKETFSKRNLEQPDQLLISPDPSELLVGMEICVNGPCAYLFLQDEAGIQKWNLSETFLEHYVVLPQASETPVPKEVLRKEFYHKPGPRRTVGPQLLKDSLLKIHANALLKNQPGLILSSLEQRFRAKVESELF